MASQTELRGRIVIATLAWAVSAAALGQQLPDESFEPSVSAPAFAADEGPRVAVDTAHHNFHTIDDRYGPFAKILRADGYRVHSIDDVFTADALSEVDILVIANAGTDADSSWALPTPSAFTDDEVDAVVKWVAGGGSLFLIADHMPAAGAAATLARRFDVEFTNGYTRQPRRNRRAGDVFSRDEDTLLDHAITRGRNEDERVSEVMSFTGQAFQATGDAEPILRFGPDAVTWLPVDASEGIDERTPRVHSGGWLHAAVLKHDRGRVAMFGEAAMFSAQVAGSSKRPMGLNHPGATDNEQLLLNVMHWLSGELDNAVEDDAPPLR
jgi:hypothetical protein